MENKNMKIIFLDIDGVLNCNDDFKGRKTSKVLNKLMIERLHKIIEKTAAKVVLSSTWRLHKTHLSYLRRNGVKYVDKTIDLGFPPSERRGKRGAEIDHWLGEHPHVKKFVILDDYDDMSYEHTSVFVQTNEFEGLTDEQVEKAIEILNS